MAFKPVTFCPRGMVGSTRNRSKSVDFTPMLYTCSQRAVLGQGKNLKDLTMARVVTEVERLTSVATPQFTCCYLLWSVPCADHVTSRAHSIADISAATVNNQLLLLLLWRALYYCITFLTATHLIQK